MKKGDKIVAIIVIFFTIISFAGLLIYKQYIKGEHRIAVIIQNDKVIESINLDEIKEKKEWDIHTEDGHFNTIRIEDGRIAFIKADCPNHECVKTGWISEPGELSVCLPNKALIKIEGEEEELDGVSY